jgi:hypothetical protein
MIEIPVIDAADQQMAATLGGRRVTLRLRYNVNADRWTFDLSIDDVPVLTGRKIVTGIDLLAPFKFGIGLLFADDGGKGILPGRTELPRGLVRLYHASEAEIA